MYEPRPGEEKPPTFQPMDKSRAEAILKEAKQVFEELRIPFFLRHGTCLGAVRDGKLIAWDDDLDIGSVIGMHGLTEEAIEPAAQVFQDHGFNAIVTEAELHVSVELSKNATQLDWTCYKVIDGNIYQWPVVAIPARLHEELKPIEFLGDTFHVPNPPEEYLEAKYGPDWRTPKQSGFEQDVLDLMPEESVSFGTRLKRLLPWQKNTTVQVLDFDGRPVNGAEIELASTVVLSGRFRYRTGGDGRTVIDLPEAGYYVLAVRHGSHEEVLFMEKLEPGIDYVYRPDPDVPANRVNVLQTYHQLAQAGRGG